jgi:hypothetical protein
MALRKKLSERSQATSTCEGPYEDVPVRMGQALSDWVATVMVEEDYLNRQVLSRARLQQVQAALRVQLDWSSETDFAYRDLMQIRIGQR